MVKLADTLVSGTSAARLGGSSPPLGINQEKNRRQAVFLYPGVPEGDLYRRTVPSEYEGEAKGCAERSRGGLDTGSAIVAPWAGRGVQHRQQLAEVYSTGQVDEKAAQEVHQPYLF